MIDQEKLEKAGNALKGQSQQDELKKPADAGTGAAAGADLPQTPKTAGASAGTERAA